MKNQQHKFLDLPLQTPDDPFTMKQRADLYNFKRLKMGRLSCAKRLKFRMLKREFLELGLYSLSIIDKKLKN